MAADPATPATPPETPDHSGAYPRLTPEQLDVLARRGERRRVSAGQVLFREGRPCEEFLVVVSGLVEVVHDRGGPNELTVAVHAPVVSWASWACWRARLRSIRRSCVSPARYWLSRSNGSGN
jgi:hypothetical protein